MVTFFLLAGAFASPAAPPTPHAASTAVPPNAPKAVTTRRRLIPMVMLAPPLRESYSAANLGKGTSHQGVTASIPPIGVTYNRRHDGKERAHDAGQRRGPEACPRARGRRERGYLRILRARLAERRAR